MTPDTHELHRSKLMQSCKDAVLAVELCVGLQLYQDVRQSVGFGVQDAVENIVWLPVGMAVYERTEDK
jgi:hypothetical protein